MSYGISISSCTSSISPGSHAETFSKVKTSLAPHFTPPAFFAFFSWCSVFRTAVAVPRPLSALFTGHAQEAGGSCCGGFGSRTSSTFASPHPKKPSTKSAFRLSSASFAAISCAAPVVLHIVFLFSTQPSIHCIILCFSQAHCCSSIIQAFTSGYKAQFHSNACQASSSGGCCFLGSNRFCSDSQ